jgi:hypothetical protein
MSNDPPAHDVSVRIEQEGANSFRIQSGQLEQIGAQLRGRREFSIFQSIILPLIVSVATIVLSSAFQYVSWFNSVGLKDATDVADKAARTYETAAAAIGTRHYATVVFLPSLRDLVQAKAEAEQSARARADLLNARAQATALPGAMAQGKGARDKDLAGALAKARRNPDADRALLSAVTQSTEDKKDNEILLHKSAADTKQKRFATYYEQLKLWNENYDHLLSEIEYTLDRPVFGQAERKNEDFRISRAKIGQMDCLNYAFSQELEKLYPHAHSLKLRFAAIHNCFMNINHALDEQLTAGTSKPLPTLDKPTEAQIKRQLDALLAMSNEFRCYAHQRIDYYNAQKELAIFSATYVWRWLSDATKTAALKHFDDTAGKCNPPKRLA